MTLFSDMEVASKKRKVEVPSKKRKVEVPSKKRKVTQSQYIAHFVTVHSFTHRMKLSIYSIYISVDLSIILLSLINAISIPLFDTSDLTHLFMICL